MLEYDDVSNDQRKQIYALRNEILEATDVTEQVTSLRHGVIGDIFRTYVPEESVEEQWDIEGLCKAYLSDLRLEVLLGKWLESEPNLNEEGLLSRAIDAADAAYSVKWEVAPAETARNYERLVLLTALDMHWREHLSALDHLRQGIHLRGYAQKNPKQEYKREAFELFGSLLELVKLEVTRTLMTVEIKTREEVEMAERQSAPALENVQYQHAAYGEALDEKSGDAEALKEAPFVRRMEKIGRNDSCPCGSGKKYKHCHGKLT